MIQENDKKTKELGKREVPEVDKKDPVPEVSEKGLVPEVDKKDPVPEMEEKPKEIVIKNISRLQRSINLATKNPVTGFPDSIIMYPGEKVTLTEVQANSPEVQKLLGAKFLKDITSFAR